MQKTALAKRKEKANLAKALVGVLKEDKKGRPKVLVVPGSKGKQYGVIIRRYDKVRKITLECRMMLHKNGYMACPDNSFKRKNDETCICGHARAALDFCIEEAGMKSYWHITEADAIKSANFGGKIYIVESHQNKSKVWMVVR